MPCLVAAVVLATGPLAAAECVVPPGDVDGNGATGVTDVQCAILGALWALDGSVGPAPACIDGDPARTNRRRL